MMFVIREHSGCSRPYVPVVSVVTPSDGATIVAAISAGNVVAAIIAAVCRRAVVMDCVGNGLYRSAVPRSE
jgi:hypothetical protein